MGLERHGAASYGGEPQTWSDCAACYRQGSRMAGASGLPAITCCVGVARRSGSEGEFASPWVAHRRGKRGFAKHPAPAAVTQGAATVAVPLSLPQGQ